MRWRPCGWRPHLITKSLTRRGRGTQPSKAGGKLQYDVFNGDIVVSGDTNGDGQADFSVLLLGVTLELSEQVEL
jgi:hypothetical protein